MTKAEIRTQIAQAKQVRPLERLSPAVLENLHQLDSFRQAQAVGLYMPLPDEVDVTPLISLPEKIFYIPAFDESMGSYRMAQYTPELKRGKFGIPEPKEPRWAEPDELNMILVPGVAFDRAGRRIGRGGGFYDQLLPAYHTVRTGICFSFQLLETIPTEPHDCTMEFLITESEILKFALNS